MPRSDLCGADFPIFYAGGQLAGTPALYSAAAVREIEMRTMGCTQPPALFVRPPYFAAFMIPWSRISYWPSFWLWRAATVVAALVFIWLWPAPREWSLLACAWSLGLAFAFTNGQDSGFLLMWLALAVALLMRGHDFAAGMALAMCAPKFHLFLLVPLLLIGRRRMLLGGAATAAALVAIAFLVQGPHWPAQFLGAITDRTINPNPAEFFNLRGTSHGNTLLEVLLAIPIVAAAWYVVRHADMLFGLAAVLAGGLLISHQQTVSDVALLVPVALILAQHPRAGYSKVLAVFLTSPIGYFLIQSPGLWEVPRLLNYAMVMMLAWEASPLNCSRPAAASELTPVSGAQSA
jgi:glycosyl transferase family 87